MKQWILNFHEKNIRGVTSKRLLQYAARVIFSLVIGFIIAGLKLDFIEFYLYDLRMRFSPHSSVSGHVEMILVDNRTIEYFHGEPGFSHYTELVEKIESTNPQFIILNIEPQILTGSHQEREKFISTVTRFKNIYFTTDQMELKGEEGTMKLPVPFQDLKLFSAPKTADAKLFAKDNVTRRMILSYQDKLMLHPFVAKNYNSKIENINEIRGLFELLDSYQVNISFLPPGSFQTYSLSDLISKSVSPDFLNKTVIVGTDTNKSFKDYISTPYSRESVAMTTTEMHANMIETLIQNNSPRKVPSWTEIFFTLIISVMTVHIVLSVRPGKGLLLLAALFVGYNFISYLLFAILGLWLNTANPLLAIFLCYYFFIPYRLIIENRKSWEFYQKNKLLQQVEELKTNFISMMSHDLKTPLARILGMTDVILKDDVKLSSHQREALDTIKHSSEDLLKFINAILQYGRIESENIQLHLQSKDVNSLLQEVIKKHEFLAKLKRIKIIAELEPLFAIELDPELMKQVFSNLIENAIKYSPEETKVLVTSEERENHVIIQVSDQGPGIPTDEIPNIFMKFFRSKGAKSSPIKGSGLGLYLAKYFIELHQGQISVESNVGQGSTFVVELPLEQRRIHVKNTRS